MGDLLQRRMDSLREGNVLIDELEEPIRHEVVVHDETLRDGEQTVGVSFTQQQKLDIARRLLDAGITHFNVGFPAVSAQEAETVHAIVKLARSPGLSCLARSKREDIEAALACEVPLLAMFIPTSDIHLKNKLRMTEDQAYAAMLDGISLAKSYGVVIRYGFEDASRTPLARLRRFATGALEAGASRVVFGDTVGILTPLSTYRLVQELSKVTGPGKIGVHLHNDLGMAVGNSIAAMSAGAYMIQCALHGLGERAGNTSLEQFVLAAQVKFGLKLGDALKLMELSRDLAKATGFPIPPNLPLLGDNVFSHESGIHVHGLTQDTATYEPFPPELVGRTHQICYGKHSGMSNIKYVAAKRKLAVADNVLAQTLAEVKRRGESGTPPTEDIVAGLLEQGMRPNPGDRTS